MDPALWTFEVDRVFKGDAATRQVVVSAISGASCGLEVAEGETYVVFAHRESRAYEPSLDGAELYAGLCDGTRLADADVVRQLGVGEAPRDGTSGIVAVGRSASWWWILAGLASLAFAGKATGRAFRRLRTSRQAQAVQ